MDMTRYEQIYGRDVLDALMRGERIYNASGIEYYFDELLWSNAGGMSGTIDTPFNRLVNDIWYIKKPFDVRQAMRDKPDEWVGAFEVHGRWRKVGFDTKNFKAVETRLFNSDIPTSFDLAEVDYLISSELDACIPLDEVPADAR